MSSNSSDEQEIEFELLAAPGKKIPVISKESLENSKPISKEVIEKCKEWAKLFKVR